MARMYPLFSSSKGNSIYVGSRQNGILIDAGVTYKKLLGGLHDCDLDVSAISAVFITHDHADHIKGLYALTKHNNLTVYGQGLTLRRLIDMEAIAPGTQIREITGNAYAAGMEISAFDTPHDTEQSCGFRITTENLGTCAICTDLGHVSKSVDDGLKGCSLILLEANYDSGMLSRGSYPPYVKARIKSANGHLSNDACAAHSEKLIQTGTTQIILGHISQENNTPMLAETTVEKALSQFVRNRDYILSVAPVQTIGEAYVVQSP